MSLQGTEDPLGTLLRDHKMGSVIDEVTEEQEETSPNYPKERT